MCCQIAVLVLSWSLQASAQPTNMEVYQQLALECLSDVPDVERLQVVSPLTMQYLRPVLVQHWQGNGIELFVIESGDDATPSAYPRLTYEIQDASVTYQRRGGKRIARTIALGLQYTLLNGNGGLLREEQCTRTYEDVIASEALERLETDIFPETQGQIPEGNLARRFLEPAVLISAVTVMTYLFFSIRSRQD